MATDRQTSYALELGDTIIVCGQQFVLTQVKLELDKPAKLTTQTPGELQFPDPFGVDS